MVVRSDRPSLADGLVPAVVLQVRPACDLRHDPAEPDVQFVLRSDDTREDAQVVGEDGGRGFIAGGFEGEKYHGAAGSSS